MPAIRLCPEQAEFSSYPDYLGYFSTIRFRFILHLRPGDPTVCSSGGSPL
jgi:hypothetical protein